ncbi:hypothetical protein ACRRTK_021118 [Alexandromys fortis]
MVQVGILPSLQLLLNAATLLLTAAQPCPKPADVKTVQLREEAEAGAFQLARKVLLHHEELEAFGSGTDIKPGTPPIGGQSTTPTSSPFRPTSTSPNSQSSKMNSIVYQKQFQSAPATVRMTQPFPAQFAPQTKQRAEVLQSTQRFFSEQQTEQTKRRQSPESEQ